MKAEKKALVWVVDAFQTDKSREDGRNKDRVKAKSLGIRKSRGRRDARGDGGRSMRVDDTLYGHLIGGPRGYSRLRARVTSRRARSWQALTFRQNGRPECPLAHQKSCVCPGASESGRYRTVNVKTILSCSEADESETRSGDSNSSLLESATQFDEVRSCESDENSVEKPAKA
uniref:Uncharacterized protein n=1 Tax=Steinernema glaseri TaxID=37863 RepID=A0A1I7YRA2_9BILA